jgi:hypothetical protein
MTDELIEYSTQRKKLRWAARPAIYRGKNCGLTTIKWAKEESPRKIATPIASGALYKTMRSPYVLPGGPDMYRAVIGRVKSDESARTAII